MYKYLYLYDIYDIYDKYLQATCIEKVKKQWLTK